MSKKWNKDVWVIISLIIIGVLFIALTLAVNYQKSIIKKQEKQIIMLENYQDDLIDYYELLIELVEMEVYIEMLEEIHKLELENIDTVILKEYIEILANYFELNEHEKADDFSEWLFDNHPYIYHYVININ